jgi:hypothetical protein
MARAAPAGVRQTQRSFPDCEVAAVRAVIVSVVLALAVTPALSLSAVQGCDSGMDKSKSKHKPSSYAPHPKAAHNSYGAPVGSKILTKRPPKKKPASA